MKWSKRTDRKSDEPKAEVRSSASIGCSSWRSACDEVMLGDHEVIMTEWEAT